MTREELKNRIEDLEEKIWWLNMADRFTPEESRLSDEWHRELCNLRYQLNEIEKA